MTRCTVERGLIPIAKCKSIKDLGEWVVTSEFPLLDDGTSILFLFSACQQSMAEWSMYGGAEAVCRILRWISIARRFD